MKEKKKAYSYFLIVLFTIFIFGIMAFFYMNYLNERISEETMISMNEISKKNASHMEDRLNHNLQSVENLAYLVAQEDLSDPEGIIERMKGLVDMNHMKRIGIADLEGNCYTSDSFMMNISSREYFQKAVQGESNVSEVLSDFINKGDYINAYATPVIQNGEIKAVFLYVKTLEEFTQDLLIESFDQQGFSFLCDSQENIILRDTKHPNQIDSLNDFHDIKDVRYFDETNHNGLVLVKDANGKECFLSFESINVNDWFVLTFVPKSVVTSKISSFSTIAFLTWFIIILFAVVFFTFFYYYKQRSQVEMKKALFIDPLTGHDNFHKFKSVVGAILEKEHEGEKQSIIEFDIHEFKMFNKIYGYAYGDDLLRTIMHAIHTYIREGEYAARISEDRFVMFLNEYEEETIRSRLSKIYAEIQNSFGKEHPGCKFAMQFGVYQIHVYDYDLMKCLDKAIYAKNNIKGKLKEFVSFYCEEMYQKIVKQKQIEERMQKALEDGEFVVYFQPKVDINSEKVVAAEALVRWKDPQNGLIPPGDFIPLFEKNGFLEVLDMYVIDTVLNDMATWMQQGFLISISVNLSRTYIFQEGFAHRIYEMAKSHEVDPSLLELEITESTMLDNPDQLITLVKQLKGYGFKVSMDDFGSGYSSLNMLKEIPIDIIKLDQVFLRSSEQTKERSKLIIEGIMDLIHLLGIDSVAEGVETKEQLEMLQEVHCHVAQGYYFYKPMPYEDFTSLL